MRRLLLQVLTVFGVLTLAFIITKSIPQDPVATLLGPTGMRNPDLVQSVTQTWKLDRPLWEQYLYYLGNIFRGELGRSSWSRGPVIDDLAARFPATVELAIFAFIIAMAIAIPTGILSAVYRDTPIDHISRVVSVAGISAPGFWWGVMFLYVFYFLLGIFPGSGRLSEMAIPPPHFTGLYLIDSLVAGQTDVFFDALRHILLPAFTLGIGCSGVTSRLTRSAMLEVLRKEYIKTARMKGLPERIVIFRHALRNSLMAPVTYMAVLFGELLTGVVFIEVIFNWRGMGEYVVNGIFNADYPVILATVIVIALIYSTANLVVDLLYRLLDPRVSIG
jgi:peptide/nickel transport system permease protein